MKKAPDYFYIFGDGPIVERIVKDKLDAHGTWTKVSDPDPIFGLSRYFDAQGKQIGRTEIDGEGDRTYNILVK